MAQTARATRNGGKRPSLPEGLHERLTHAFGGIEDAGRDILLLLLRSGADTLGVQDAAILTPRSEEHLGFLTATNEGLLRPELPPVPIDSSIAGFVFVSAQTMSLDQATASPEFFDKIDKSVPYETKEYLASPIVGGETVLGVLTFVNRTRGKGTFLPEEIELASRYAMLCALVMQHNECSQHLVAETLDAMKESFESTPATASPGAVAGAHLQARSAIVDALEGLDDSELDLVRDLIERLRGGSQLAF